MSLRQADTLLKENVDLQKVKCRVGCNHCCKINVDISNGEADLIVSYCRENGIKINRQYLEAQRNLTIKTRSKSKQCNCIFLSDKGTCKIYEVRPLNCRKYFVQSDPALCDPAKHRKGIVDVNFQADTEILASAYKSTGAPVGLMANMILHSMDKTK